MKKAHVIPEDELRKIIVDISIMVRYHGSSEAYNKIAEKFPAVEQKEQGWVRVEDGLPKDEEEVLCLFTGWDDMQFQRTLSYDKIEKNWYDWNGVKHETVTHWQPLPDKPERT